jgi:hypothetical protein
VERCCIALLYSVDESNFDNIRSGGVLKLVRCRRWNDSEKGH